MVNFNYPLPKEKLIARYACVFEGLKTGQSCLLISLPQNNRAAWLKFILRNEENMLEDLIDTEKFHFIEIDESKITSSQLLKLLVIKLGHLKSAPPGLKNLAESNFLSEEPSILLAKLEQSVGQISKAHTLVLFLPRAEELFAFDPSTIDLVSKIANIRRSLPNPLFCLLLGGNPTFLEKKNDLSMSPLWQYCSESVCFMPLLDSEELVWTQRRVEYFTQQKFSTATFERAKKLSGGHIRLFIDLLQNHNLKPETHSVIKLIWDNIPVLAKQNWHVKFIVSYEPLKHFRIQDQLAFFNLFPPKSIAQPLELIGKSSLPQLTAQEKLIFDYLLTTSSRVITRDELAQVIWGKLWQEKYSDWAIDRSISKLRKKLSTTSLSINSLRNRGYRIILT